MIEYLTTGVIVLLLYAAVIGVLMLFTDKGSRWSYQPIPRDPFWLEVLGGA